MLYTCSRDDESPDTKSKTDSSIQGMPIGLNPFMDTPQNAAATEHKKGYVMRKCCYDSNYKKSEFTIIKQATPPSTQKINKNEPHWCSVIRSICVLINHPHTESTTTTTKSTSPTTTNTHLQQKPKPRAGNWIFYAAFLVGCCVSIPSAVFY